ncbi:MAG: hypothetical protein PHG97_06455 [Candidatus Margulisbacteria bacterium]|nr:hypothetical protein [Candidatus Margulisiibacteriota bacterium]
MKKILIAALLLGLLVSSVFAIESGLLPIGVGGKYSGMGGAGASIVDDITAAYYNPAGIVHAGTFGLKIGAGAATKGLNDLMATFGNSSDPSKFLVDNFNKTIDVNGGINAIVGLNIANLGISVIPVGNLAFTKPTAGTLTGTTLNGWAAYEGVLTLGHGFSLPMFPAGIDLGFNVKSANYSVITEAIVSGTTSGNLNINYSGIGYDIGAKARIDTPVVPISVGIVMKDISETLKGKAKTSVTTINPVTGTSETTTPVETDVNDLPRPTTTVISASTVIPVINLKVAADIDSVASYSYAVVSGAPSTAYPAYSLTHLGVEYPVLGGLIAVRGGTVSGGPAGGEISQTTYGLGVSFGLGLNVTAMIDNKNSKNNSTYADFGFAF